ncbi:MAG: hypothetical protein AAFP19_04225 [Bacteroidota bacterium]
MLLKAALIVPLAAIIYEDFRYRAIHWIWVALLALGAALFFPLHWPSVGLNLGFLAIQGILLTLYFSIRQGTWINITHDYLGIGDVVFFLPLCLLFSPVNLILFFVVGLSLSLIGFLGFCWLTRREIATVPLAGCLAVILIPLLIGTYYFEWSLHRDLFLNFI